MHIKATITFDKYNDSDKLEIVEDCITTYNMIATYAGTQVLNTDEVDCGDTVEIRVDTDFDTRNFDKFSKMLEQFKMPL